MKLFENPVENLIRIEWIKRPHVSMGSSYRGNADSSLSKLWKV